MLAAAIVALCALVAEVDAGAMNFRGSGQVSKPEVADILRQEIADSDHHLVGFEDTLRQMFTSLPKNAHGNLGHQTVRYALNRFFVDRFGWFFAGLDPVATPSSSDLPTLLQNSLESQSGDQGVDLHGLAALAASLEDLADKELQLRLRDAYNATDVPSVAAVPLDNATGALETFFISFLISNNWTVTSKQDLTYKKGVFHEKYRDHDGTMAWYEPIRDRHLGMDARQQVPFESAAMAAYEMARTYHHYNNEDCKDLKTTLMNIESRRPGRVRLSAFYNMSIYSHWAFNEKVDFLRSLGVLDESDPKQPSIIIPNYAMSRQNCLNATSVFAICCRNTCEDLTAQLEKEIQAPMATVDRIVELVSNLPSESVSAPRELPAALVGRLREVAMLHDGQVPLHGRLFAQWMHHAYPLECPFPHEVGSTTVQSPDEWMAQTGQATQEASPEEMRQHVEADTCALNFKGKVDCGEESVELPWSMSEELLTSGIGGEETGDLKYLMFALVCLLAALGFTWPIIPSNVPRAGRSGIPRHVLVLISLLLIAAAYFSGLLDGIVFAVALLGSFVAGLVKVFVRSRRNTSIDMLHRPAKTV